MGWFWGVGSGEEGPGDNSVITVVVQMGAEEKELEPGLTGQVLGTVSPPACGQG